MALVEVEAKEKRRVDINIVLEYRAVVLGDQEKVIESIPKGQRKDHLNISEVRAFVRVVQRDDGPTDALEGLVPAV